MNLKTTFFLIVLLGAGVGGWYWLQTQKVEEPASPTLTFLKDSLDAKKIQRVEVLRGKDSRFVLERTGNEWSLPGKWPARTQESEQWIDELAKLRSRFAPIPITKDADLITYGLEREPLTIRVAMGDTTHTLRFGEEPSGTNRFTRPTYMRLNDQKEIIRLGPGVLAALDQSTDYFQQRRLFQTERVQRDEDAKDKVEQLIASAIDVQSETEKFSLVKMGQDWVVKDAFTKQGAEWKPLFSQDRVDPAKIKSLLTAYPDLWADKFVDAKDKKLEDFGLKDPEFTVTVTRPSGAKSTLLLGRVSDKKVRMLGKPPQPNPFGPPPKAPQMVTEEYRFAKLENNPQIFEIKSEKFADALVSLQSLRDPQVARFKADDVRRIEIQQGDSTLVFVKTKENDKEKWRFEKPLKEDAETKQIEDVLEKLSGLQAREKEIIDNADVKDVGLAKPGATIKLELEEGKADKKKREIVFQLGQKDKEKDKLYVRVDGWPRVNQVGDELMKLVARPALAYRNRRVLDIAASDVNKIEIVRAEEKYAFEKVDKDWKLTSPTKADVESSRVASLANDLAKIEAVELVSETPKEDELAKVYGLAKPKLSATLHAKDSKTAKTLTLGNVREGKQEFYARIDNGPVFTVKKDLRDDLDKTSLSYRPLQLWQIDPDTITEVAIQKDGAAYSIKKSDKAWKIAGPFDAEVQPIEAEELTEGLARLRAERFEAHQEKNLAKFGLDKPAYKVTIAGKEKRVLAIGNKVGPLDENRFAKLADGDAIFVLDQKTITPLKRDAFDYLDKTLLSLNVGNIQRIRYQGASSFALEPKGEQWAVVDSPAATFNADEVAADQALSPWRILRADKYVAYGPKIDWAKYGLDKPAITILVTMKADAKDKKATEHMISLGKEADGGRYARFDKKDAVVLLDAKKVEALNRTHLDFIETSVLKFDLDAVNSIRRTMANGDLELTKREDNWQLAKPTMRDADNLTVGDILEKTFRLKAKRIAAYPAKDLAPFGLDKPFAVVTLQTEAGKHVIKVGNLAKDAARKDTDERYALIDNVDKVVVLSPELSRHLVAPVLYFADRNLASFSGVDTAIVKRGAREATFRKADAWQMTAPVKSEAEDAGLEELIRLLLRLRADEIVAEKGADLKKFGLDQPIVQWRFKSGDAEKLNLLVGGLENDKPGARRYAKLGNQEQVFLLSPKLTAKATDEYRSRKPWPALDAAQVEELTATSPDKTFTLRKKDGKWSVPGEDVAVKADIVVDTLDALASLKALRYEADAKADLQLYGLAKPVWKIEVQTPMGKRELWLGRNEGASKRFYATTPGSDAVFVVDDEQSLRIARPLAAFVEKEKKK